MGFEFKSDQPKQQLVDNTTTLSVSSPVLGRIPKNRNIQPTIVEENLVQPIFIEGEEEKLAIQFIEENELYTKFMLWCGLQDQLKKLNDSLDK